MRVNPSDMKSLQVFRAVVEHGGFVGAQVALNMGQPAVSFHIKALEERLGFRLCQRGRGGFSLTEKGVMVYERSKTLFSAVSNFESEIGELRHAVTGRLRVGVVDNTITDPSLPVHQVVHEFLRKAENAHLEIKVGIPEQLVSEIASGGLDLAIMPETRPYKGITFSRFYVEMHSLYCAAGHPLARLDAAALDAATIELYPFVVRPYANLTELQHFRGAQMGATASNMEAQAMFVLSGHFIGYLPDHFAQYWVDRGALRPLLRETTRIASPFHIVTRQNERRSLLLRSFIRELVAASLQQAHAA